MGIVVRYITFIIALCLLLQPLTAWSQDKVIRFVLWKSEAPKLWDEAIAAFEKDNPGTKIVREIGPHSSTQFHDLITQKLKNRDPKMDVFLMDVVWPAEFASAGWALPLDKYFPAEEQAKFLAAPMSADRYNGQTFGVPLFVDAGLLYYRKDLLEKYGFKPPRYWSELVANAKAIMAGENDPQLVGFSGQFKQYEGLICNMLEYVYSNGGTFWDPKALASSLQTPEAQAAVRFVRDRIIREVAHQGVLAYQEPESLALFNQGRAVFLRSWPYAWKVANNPEQSRIAGKVGMAPLPSFEGQRGAATLGGWHFGISRFSKHPELAWRFIEFMSAPAMQKKIALMTGRPPTRLALYDDPELVKAMPQLPDLLAAFKQAIPRPTTPVYVPMSNIMQRYFSSVLSLPDSNIAERSALAAREINRVLDLLKENAAK